MLSTREITGMISEPLTGAKRGRLKFVAQREQRPTATSTTAQRKFLADMADTAPSGDPNVYQHPENMATGRRADGPLTPAELTWLQRIPTNPAAVPFTDAQALATMSRGVQRGTPDAMLVDSVWHPVKHIHDVAEAKVAKANVSQPLPPIPSSALSALAEAVRTENGQLTESEAIARASSMIQDASARRTAARDAAVAAAHDKLLALQDAHRQRTATTA